MQSNQTTQISFAVLFPLLLMVCGCTHQSTPPKNPVVDECVLSIQLHYVQDELELADLLIRDKITCWQWKQADKELTTREEREEAELKQIDQK